MRGGNEYDNYDDPNNNMNESPGQDQDLIHNLDANKFPNLIHFQYICKYKDNQYEGMGSQDGQGDTATKKLVGSRVARKRAEEDVKLLQNRILLLKMEEKQALKKIEETKKKAKEIMQVKNRNQKTIKIKEQRAQEKQLEEQMLAQCNQNMKHQIKETIQMTKEQQLKKVQEEAERLKLEKREQKEFLNMQKQQEYLKNASMRQMIKNQEMEVEERRRRDIGEKKAKNRQGLQQKIIQENQRRLQIDTNFCYQIESEFSQMEQEELELIQRLQNTQVMQKSAYEDLEGALNGQISPDQFSQSTRDFSPVKSLGSDQKNARPQTSGGSGNYY